MIQRVGFSSRTDVLEHIKWVAEQNGLVTISKALLTRYFSEEGILHYFPSIDDAIREAGFYPRRPSEQDLIRSLQEYYDKHHRVPTAMEAQTSQLPYSYQAYVKWAESWNQAIARSGLVPNKRKG